MSNRSPFRESPFLVPPAPIARALSRATWILAMFAWTPAASGAPREFWVEATFADDSFVTPATAGDRYLLVVTVDDEVPPIDAGNAQIFPGTSDLYLNGELAYDDVEGAINQFDFGLMQFKAITGPGLTFIPFALEDPAILFPGGPKVLADPAVLVGFNVVTDENDGEGRRTAVVGRAPLPRGGFRYSVSGDGLAELPLVHDTTSARNDATVIGPVDFTELGVRPDRSPNDAGTQAFVLSEEAGIQTVNSRILSNDKVAAGGGFTLETWLQWSGEDDELGVLIGSGETQLFVAGAGGVRGVAPGNVALSFGERAAETYTVGEVTAGAWHHVAVVFDTGGAEPAANGSIAGTLRTFLDGEMTGEFTGAVKTPAGEDGPITIGQPFGFTGLLFEPRVSLRPLTRGELLVRSSGAGSAAFIFDAAPSTSGPPGANKSLVARALFQPGSLDEGIRAWSLGFRVEGGAVLLSAELPSAFEGLPSNDSFVTLEVGADGRSVSSAVVLSFRSEVLLPVDRDTELLEAEISATLPPSGCSDISLRFVDGIRGSGTFVRNEIIASDGADLSPELGVATVELCADESALEIDRSPLDLGAVAIGGSARRELTIRNLGAVDRHVESLAFMPNSSPEFSVHATPSSGAIPAAGELVVTVTYRPNNVGGDEGTLRIVTDDPVNSDPVDIVVRGRGVAQPVPQLEVEPLSRIVDFKTVKIGSESVKTVTLRNAGGATLTVQSIAIRAGSSTDFTLRGTPQSAEIAPNGGELEVLVVYTPTAARTVGGTLSIESDDPDEGSVRVTLRGTGESEGDGVRFRRGDPDASGGGNITDAIAVLNYLFAGGSAPKCLESADTNSDGSVNIADPIFHLTYLFLGGPAPAAPGPDACGPDPSPATSLGCDSYESC